MTKRRCGTIFIHNSANAAADGLPRPAARSRLQGQGVAADGASARRPYSRWAMSPRRLIRGCSHGRRPPAPSLLPHVMRPPQRHALRLSARFPPAKRDVPSVGSRAASCPVARPSPPSPPLLLCHRGLVHRDVPHDSSAALSVEARLLRPSTRPRPQGAVSIPHSLSRGVVCRDVPCGRAHGDLVHERPPPPCLVPRLAAPCALPASPFPATSLRRRAP